MRREDSALAQSDIVQCRGGVMLKFDFTVLTKDGQRVESVVIAARDQDDAERKLKQMYRYCEIVRCGLKEEESGNKSGQVMSVEEILTLISK
jgi:hypothetical protein